MWPIRRKGLLNIEQFDETVNVNFRKFALFSLDILCSIFIASSRYTVKSECSFVLLFVHNKYAIYKYWIKTYFNLKKTFY